MFLTVIIICVVVRVELDSDEVKSVVDSGDADNALLVFTVVSEVLVVSEMAVVYVVLHVSSLYW